MTIKLNKILSMLLVAMFIVTITASAVSAERNNRPAPTNDVRVTLTTGASTASATGGLFDTGATHADSRLRVSYSNMDTTNNGGSSSGSNTLNLDR